MESSSKYAKLLTNLHASKEFKSRAAKMGLRSLQDVLDQDLRLLKKHPFFSYVWYTDLLNILNNEGLLDDFQKRLSR